MTAMKILSFSLDMLDMPLLTEGMPSVNSYKLVGSYRS